MVQMDVDRDRPHFRTTTTGSSTATAANTELFICLASRLSSSSMKLSKSILSPGRAARDGGPVSLSSSLSRRLRTNGSLKGGQASPFFTTTGKKRGCGFENPEPSSPKVTCIGQVRVKTKKKVKQTRSLSKRRSAAGGEVSFRKIEHSCGDGDDKVGGPQQQQRYSNASAHYQPPQECLPHRNQRWVHLPISICEALRNLGAEFSCLFPCRSSCSSTSERDKCEKQTGDENGCGAVFARWLVSVNDGEGGKRREIELVVGGGDEEEEEEEESVSMRTSRRHVFEDFEVKDDKIELKGKRLEREEEAGRVSICIPPKNALLLMRCGSDPMKMAALANRFSWDPAAVAKTQNEDVIIEEKEEEITAVDCKDEVFEQEAAVLGETNEEKDMTNEIENKLETEGDVEEIEEEEISNEEMVEDKTEELEIIAVEGEEKTLAVEEEGGERDEEEEVESNMSSFEALLDQENAEHYEDCCPVQDEEEVEEDTAACHLSPSTESDEDEEEAGLKCTEVEESAAAMDKPTQELSVELNEEENQSTETTADEGVEEEDVEEEQSPEKNQQIQEFASKNEVQEKKEKEGPLLPECLLLMMCEPKLSMEVSKETWVCSTDFTRWLPERPRRAVKAAKPGGCCDQDPVKRRLSIDSKPPKHIIEKNELHQPPRSSCSLPAAAAAMSMASMIEQKLVNAVAYEPFVLTRCKSEPMKTAAAKLMPESCFWKNAVTVRKLEPHRCATMGVGGF